MTLSKRALVWAVAALAGVVLLTPGCRREPSTPATPRTPARPSSRAQRASEEKASLSAIDLASLLTDVPEYQGRGRNLFAFGQERSVAPVPPTPPAATATTSVPAAEAVRTPRTAPANIDLKFAGFVEKTEPSGVAKKYAVLLDGVEILTGAEGDLVGNRYKIVEIGLESVTVALEGSQVTQKIPLRTN